MRSYAQTLLRLRRDIGDDIALAEVTAERAAAMIPAVGITDPAASLLRPGALIVNGTPI